MAMWASLYPMDPNSNIMEQLLLFHDHAMMIIIMITVMTLFSMIMMTLNKLIDSMMMDSQKIETLWTIMPAIILIMIALPSIKLLYMMDEVINPSITIKAIGHQWYWSYEYSDFKNIEFESYMKPEMELNTNEMRLLEVDNRLILPINNSIRILVSSTDVIHSWTVPAIGVKIDATPGRLNQSMMKINRPGIMYGQCSEICGANHSFMPIMIESITMKKFIEWINKY
uniref:Cytochrome c oxidase subunit 2 n=1 Tax=Aradacanthia heissi TaxID=928818 RepID=I6LNL9_9HEMI|nr:cytochrome c oxidase subunit II [Aradacanthia heissi]